MSPGQTPARLKPGKDRETRKPTNKQKAEPMKTITVCLYTRKHPDGGTRSRYLEATNENLARKFATIDGERWTNRGLVVGDPEISTAEHEQRRNHAPA